MNITQESTGKLTATIKIEVVPGDYETQVSDALKDVQKKANLKGFRPGKVPFGLIKKMYGKGALAEEVNKILSDSLNNYLTENKIEVLGYPLASKKNESTADFENNSDFEFFFDIGIVPEINPEVNDKTTVDYYEIDVEKEKVDGYLKEVCARHGKPINPATADKGDLIKGEIAQVNAQGEMMEDGVKNTTSLSLNFIKDENVQNEFIGAKVGDTIKFNPLKATDNKSETASLLGINKDETAKLEADYQFTITEISRIEPAEINEELFMKVYPNDEIKTEEEFRNKLKGEAKEYLQKESDNFFVHETLEVLSKNTEVNLPDEFIKRFMMETDEKVTEESVDHDYEHYSKSLKQQLIINKISKDNEINIEAGDVKDFIKNMYAKQFMMNLEDEEKSKQLDMLAESVMKNQEETKRIYDQLYDERMREVLKSKLKLNTIEIFYDDFVKKVNEHHHTHHNHEHEH
jgi:trigger factor